MKNQKTRELYEVTKDIKDELDIQFDTIRVLLVSKLEYLQLNQECLSKHSIIELSVWLRHKKDAVPGFNPGPVIDRSIINMMISDVISRGCNHRDQQSEFVYSESTIFIVADQDWGILTQGKFSSDYYMGMKLKDYRKVLDRADFCIIDKDVEKQRYNKLLEAHRVFTLSHTVSINTAVVLLKFPEEISLVDINSFSKIYRPNNDLLFSD